MNSVQQERAGTASGINNAVARVAGVLAVAVLGALMAGAFAHSLRRSIASLNLNVSIVRQLESNVAKLGSLDVPLGVDSQTAVAIRSAIDDAFIFGFRLIVLVCAALAEALRPPTNRGSRTGSTAGNGRESDDRRYWNEPQLHSLLSEHLISHRSFSSFGEISPEAWPSKAAGRATSTDTRSYSPAGEPDQWLQPVRRDGFPI